MSLTFRTFGVLVVALGSSVLAGCGGDDAEPLTRAEYVKQADAICKKFDTQASKIAEPKDFADLERVARQTKPLLQDELDELRKLEAPDDVAKEADEAYDLLEESLPKLDELAEAGRKKDTKTIQRVAEEAGKLSEQADQRAKRIGLRVCGSS